MIVAADAQLQPVLTRAEWQAVAIALNDAAGGAAVPARRPGPLARVYAIVTGNVSRPPLADARLEAIRRFVWTTRRQRRPAEEGAAELERLGFTRAQVEALALLAAT